jgi:riboflavin synthase
MFTGIVEALGTLSRVEPLGSGYRLRVETTLAPQLALGDSLAVNGVCLTIVQIAGAEVQADVGPETTRVTNLGRLQAGQRVNLERPMRLDGRLGGHLVLGHVDGVGSVSDIRGDTDSHWITVNFPPALAPLFIRKGSVAVDGVSLTVADLDAGHFDVQVIPYTWQHTTFHLLRPGDLVNLECDMIGKYVVRAMDIAGRDRR